MRLTRTLTVVCAGLLAAFALVGCVATSSQIPISTPIPRLTLDLLKNAEYLFPIGDKYVRLIDGVYQEREGSVTPTLQLWEQPIVFADLNADGLEDALVILEFGAGGSGHGPILAIVLNENGRPHEIADAGLGDRTKTKDIRVDGQTISLDVVTHRLEDGLCCPTLDATWQFRFEDIKLIPLQ